MAYLAFSILMFFIHSVFFNMNYEQFSQVSSQNQANNKVNQSDYRIKIMVDKQKIMIHLIINFESELKMLKIKRFLALQNLASNLIPRQHFSILYMGEKQFDPPTYDVLIRDIDGQDLHGKISQLLGKPYLSPLKKDQEQYADIRTGIIFGSGRGIITIPTIKSTRSQNQSPIWVHYLIDTGSPYTYLSKQALDALHFKQTQFKYSVFINNQSNSVRHSTVHFSQVNLLGMDFLENQLSLFYDMDNKTITLADFKKEN